jgi:hypothetical protein
MQGKHEAAALFVKLGVFLAEAVNAACRIHKTLLAGKKGMAGGANFHLHLLALGGKRFHPVAAGAGDVGLVHLGMNFFFHALPHRMLNAKYYIFFPRVTRGRKANFVQVIDKAKEACENSGQTPGILLLKPAK